jgi:hypothetical protein
VRVILPVSVSHIEELLAVSAAGAVAGVYKIISKALLTVPLTTGLLLTTRILYAFPLGVFAGILQVIVPLFASLSRVPITTGAAKEPRASDSCTLYVLELNTPVEV